MRTVLPFRRSVFLLLFALSLPALHAQTPVFRSGVDIVRIDAVVVDAKGMPIRGLKAEDFVLLEEGKPRPIVGFDAVELPVDNGVRPGEAAWVRAAPRDVVTNKLEDRRLFMILIDDAVMPRDPRPIARAKLIARDVVSRLGANDHAAVVFSMMSKNSQVFTADHARLDAAIATTSAGGGSDPDYASAWTVANAVAALKSAPQGRKTLVLISGGANYPKIQNGPNRVRDEMNRAFAEALKSHVNVYSFDVNDFGYVVPGPGGVKLPDLNSPERDYLRIVAANTGGRVTVANDDPVKGVTQMFRESSEYYLLGFTPESTGRGLHDVEVRTTRAGAKVLSRKRFELGQAEPAVATPLASAMADLLPIDSLPLRVVASALPGPTPKEAIVAIAVGINQPTDELNGAAEKMTAQIDAYQATGKFIRATKLDAQLTLKPSTSGRAQYDLLGKLSLPPGRYQLRIAAHSARLNLRGSVFADLDVPDFSRRGVVVAPLVLSATPAPLAAPANAFADLLPAAPTSHRSFVGSDRVSVLARVVEGGNRPLVPVRVDVTVVDTNNRRVFAASETLSPDAGAVNRAVDYVFDLPAATLPVGDYLLTVKASTPDGANEKSVRFTRR